MSLREKVKTGLDETRLLLLGAQVLFGFQLNSVFQEGFTDLSPATRLVNSMGQALMAVAIGLLIAPSMQHLIAEKRHDTLRLHQATGWFAACALFPFGISLGLSFYVIFDCLYGPMPALVVGTAFSLLALLFWYGIALMLRSEANKNPPKEKETGTTPLHARIDQMLTEARVILPGAQALLGFQLTVTLTHAFDQLPPSSRLLHVAALISVAFAIILLMTPAALHRISFYGEDTERFLKIGSWLVVTASVPLAIGIATDLYVAISKASDSAFLGTILAVSISVILAVLWYGLPLYLRKHQATERFG